MVRAVSRNNNKREGAICGKFVQSDQGDVWLACWLVHTVRSRERQRERELRL